MMTDEERLHMITEQLIIVRDNLFRGMSKSMQKLQARSINEVLELPNFTESPQRTAAVGEDTRRAWVGLTDEEYFEIGQRHWLPSSKVEQIYYEIEAKLKAKNERLEKNT